ADPGTVVGGGGDGGLRAAGGPVEGLPGRPLSLRHPGRLGGGLDLGGRHLAAADARRTRRDGAPRSAAPLRPPRAGPKPVRGRARETGMAMASRTAGRCRPGDAMAARRAIRAGTRQLRYSPGLAASTGAPVAADRKSTRLNSSHGKNSYAVFCLKKKNS